MDAHSQADARQGQQLQGRPGLPVQDQPAAAKGMRQAGRDQEGRLAVAQHEMPQRMQPVAAQLEEKLASSGSRLNAASSMIHPSRAEVRITQSSGCIMQSPCIF